MPDIRAFIFDMDGVIVDSNPLHRVVWEEYNRRHGLATTEAMHQRMYGKRNDQIVRDFFGEDLSPDQVFAHGAAKEALYREMLRPDLAKTLVPGVREFLEKHSGLPTALATNAEPLNVNFILDEAGLRRYFRAAVDGHQVENPKPHPEVYLRAADLLGIEPQYCLIFEDSGAGVQAAQAAGMRVIGLSTTHQELPGAELMIRDFNDPALEAWLSDAGLNALRKAIDEGDPFAQVRKSLNLSTRR